MDGTITINFKINSKLKNLLIKIWVTINPMYWNMIYAYSNSWDYELNNLMDNYDFTDIDEYTAKLNGVEIWIANHPYASFRPYPERIRPSKYTIYKGMEKLKKDIEKTKTKEVVSEQSDGVEFKNGVPTTWDDYDGILINDKLK